MTERLVVAALSVLSLLGVWLAPWAALSRQAGGRSAVLLLPERLIDFSGRTATLPIGGLGLVLALTLLGLGVILLASPFKGRLRALLWLAAGLLLIVTTAWGLEQVKEAVFEARLALVETALGEAVAAPQERFDVPALRSVLEEAPETPIATSVLKARQAGFTIRRLAYEGSGIGLSAFLAYLTGALALTFGLRVIPAWRRWLGRVMTAVAVPLTSILLALLAAGVVILLLQPTPVGGELLQSGWQTTLAGRLEVLWFAYLTLFANSLGTVGGLAESLKFATPLIFTGLAVAFGFRAGLFNIGAPGQMVLGALGAMLAGLYLPGPRLLVLPLAVLAAALGGAFWGAIPGWLKARFGANEVINTILLNYIAASLLLFMLSSQLSFAAGAIRIFTAIGILVLAALLLNLLPPVRRFFKRAPRLAFAAFGVMLLATTVLAGLPRPGDRSVSFTLPFKAPGSEPKSYLLQETARLQQLPDLVGVDPASSGEAIVTLDLAPWLGLLALALGFWLLSRLLPSRLLWQRLLFALGVGGAAYLGALLLGWGALETVIPPTSLNTSFVLALLSAVFMQVFLWRTKWGYELRAVGASPKAAEYGGANLARNTVLALALSGAFAGLTACHYVLGGALEEYSLRQAIPTDDGFDGIAVALLGGNTPLGVVLAAFLFGVLKNGGTVLNITFSNLTRDVVSMILALVVLFIAARGFLPERLTDPLRRRPMPETTVAANTVQPPTQAELREGR